MVNSHFSHHGDCNVARIMKYNVPTCKYQLLSIHSYTVHAFRAISDGHNINVSTINIMTFKHSCLMDSDALSGNLVNKLQQTKLLA